MVELDLAVLVITVPPPGWGVGGMETEKKRKKENRREQIRVRNAICPRIVCKSSYHCSYPLWYPCCSFSIHVY